MKMTDLLEETYLSLSVNKVRSGLTMLGIVIGIASVIAMVGIGQGSQQAIEQNINAIGANLILVSPGVARTAGAQLSAGRGSAETLTKADADAIASSVTGIAAVAPEDSHRYQITAPGKNTNTTVDGTTSSYPKVRNLSIGSGTFFSDSQNKGGAKVAVIGPTTRDDLFGTNATNAIGATIRINGVDFKVIGITVAKGGSGFSNADDMVYVPITTAQRFLDGSTSVTTIDVEASSQDTMSSVQQQVTTLLLTRHKITNPALADFTVLNQTDLAATASSVTGTFTTLLACIAGISLLVGGIGIMNMMLTTVTERTREIGLRKAIGGKRHDISRQFLAESVALTFIGGVLGVILGFLAGWILQAVASVTSAISPISVLGAFGVSALIGIVFGYYPARRAAMMRPMEALRYE